MANGTSVLLPERGLVTVGGADARPFLQDLVSNDIDKVSAARAVYAALLTPQGKYLHDFFIVQLGDALHLDCEAARADDLVRRLTVYRLRAKVTLERPPGLAVAAAFGDGALDALGLSGEPGSARPFAGGVAYTAPRLAAVGARTILPAAAAAAAMEGIGLAAGEPAAYDRMRISLGLPDGGRDLEIEKSILLENGFDELNGVDWDKGCFVGQELTARTHYRGLIKKRLVPVEIEGPVPAPGTRILLDGRDAGTMRSGRDGLGLALLRLDAMAKMATGGETLAAGEVRLTPKKPGWAAF